VCRNSPTSRPVGRASCSRMRVGLAVVCCSIERSCESVCQGYARVRVPSARWGADLSYVHNDGTASGRTGTCMQQRSHISSRLVLPLVCCSDMQRRSVPATITPAAQASRATTQRLRTPEHTCEAPRIAHESGPGARLRAVTFGAVRSKQISSWCCSRLAAAPGFLSMAPVGGQQHAVLTATSMPCLIWANTGTC
jgi:hypothetical protein